MDHDATSPWPEVKDPGHYEAEDRAALSVKGVAENGSFEGHASIFDKKDLQDEIMERGAFARTVQHKKGRFPLLWQHNKTEPIGIVLASEVQEGLKVQGKLALGVTRAKDAYELLKADVLTGMSIGFRVIKDDWDRLDGARRLKEVDLWEVSLVTFPAHPLAGVHAVKSMVPFANLHVAAVGVPWDPIKAEARVRAWSACDSKPNQKYKSAFLSVDPERVDEFAAYRLPIADVIDGQLVAVPAALFAAAASLLGGVKNARLSDTDAAAARAHLARYYRKLERSPPWEAQKSIQDIYAHVVDLAPYSDAEDLPALSSKKSDQSNPSPAPFDWLDFKTEPAPGEKPFAWLDKLATA